MFSKLATRATQYQQLTALSQKAFRASTVTNSKKPSIGDAVTILQSKVSQINQVVSFPAQSKTALEGKQEVPISYLLTASARVEIAVVLTSPIERLERVRNCYLHR